MSAHLLKRCPALALTVLMTACAAEQLDRPPPAGAFYFPTGVAHVAADGGPGFLYVANSNFDRRFDRGSVTAVDLSLLALPTIDAGLVDPDAGTLAPEPAPAPVVIEDLQLSEQNVAYIENFAGQIATLPLEGRTRLVVPTRSEGGIVHLIDAEGANLNCAGVGGRECRLDERVVARDDTVYPRAPEPFGVAVIPGTTEAYVSQLEAIEPELETTTAAERQHFLVKLDAAAPQASIQLDPPEPAVSNASFIPVGLGAADTIAVGARYLYVSGRLITPPTAFLVRLVNRETGAVLNSAIEGAFRAEESRGIGISADETRLYLSTRAPDALIVLRLTGVTAPMLDPVTGLEVPPRLELVRSVFIPDGAGPLQVINREGRAPLVAVASQEAGVVSFYDDEIGQLVTSVGNVGLQPFSLALQREPEGVVGAVRLFVSNFRDGRIAVIDVPDVSAAHRARVSAYLGSAQTCLTSEGRDERCNGEAQ